MKIETFEMERMQSTWESLVDYDMSESGVRPLTLRELAGMGFDLEAFLDQPLGYSQSNGTIELRERIAAFAEIGVQHVMVHPLNRDTDDWDDVIEGVGRLVG